MKLSKQLAAFLLVFSIVFSGVPPVSFAALEGWTVVYDSSAFARDSIKIGIYDASEGFAPAVSWTDSGSSIKADKTAAELFPGSGDYYAVVQFSDEGSSGQSGSLSDAEIEAEYDKYWIALHGSLPPEAELPENYPYESREEALEWYSSVLGNSGFVSWFEDPDSEDYGYELLTADQLVSDAESGYDPEYDDPSYVDEEIVSGVNEIVEAYIQYLSGGDYNTASYYSMTTASKRATIETYIAYPQYAPEGYTPPGASASVEACVKSVVRLLSASEKANGFTIGEGFFDNCTELSISPLQHGTTVNYQTYQNEPLYADTAVYRVFGDAAVPAFIKSNTEGEEEEGSSGYVDVFNQGFTDNLYGRGHESKELTGLVNTGAAVYAEPGSHLVTAVCDAMSDDSDPAAVIDWETVNLGAGGGSVSFAGERSYVNIDVSGTTLPAADNIISLRLRISGGDLKTAAPEAELFGSTFNMQTSSMVSGVQPLKIKAGSYGTALLLNTSSNLDISTGEIPAGEVIFAVSFWEGEAVGSLSGDQNWTAPVLSQNSSDYSASLVFTADDGSEAPFAEGTKVNGRMLISTGGWNLCGILVMKQDVQSLQEYSPAGFEDITAFATSARYADGISITPAYGKAHVWFSTEAPAESQTVNAVSSISAEGIINLEFSASALLDTGTGSGEITQNVSAVFSAESGSLE